MNSMKLIIRTLLSLVLVTILMLTGGIASCTEASESTAEDINKSIDFNKLYSSKNFYDSYLTAIDKLTAKYGSYDGLFKTESIGESSQGRKLISVVLGNPRAAARIEINATHHQKEYINTILVLNQIEFIMELYKSNGSYAGKQVSELLEYVQICFIPLVNPDGVEIFNNYRYKGLRPKGFKVQDITRGNANKVNLNRNYPAGFKESTESGPCPFSEPETIALKKLHEATAFDYSIAYHSCGNKILWFYDQEGTLYKETLEIANLIKSISGYSLSKDEKSMNAYGAGFKDWLLTEGIAACTIENGTGSLGGDNTSTVNWNQYQNIWSLQKDIPLAIANYFYEKEQAASDALRAQLKDIKIKVNGTHYNRDIYSLRDKIYVNSREFVQFTSYGIKALENSFSTGNIPEKVRLEGNFLYIDGKEFTLLEPLVKSLGYYIFKDETNNNELNAASKDYLLSFIKPIWVEAVMIRDSNIFADEGMTTKIGTFQKGDKVILLQDRSEVKANVKNGDISGWTFYKNVRASSDNYLKNGILPVFIKEFHVNNMDYQSDTDKLIWVNLENTTVNIFEESPKDWKLLKAFPCAIGKNSTPTVNGVFKYYKHTSRVNYYNWYLIHKMDFYKKFGLHSVLLNSDGSYGKGQINTAVSHGCIRMLPDDIKWIYNNCSIGTTVVIQ